MRMGMSSVSASRAPRKNDRDIFRSINRDIYGIIIADAGYVSKQLENDMDIDGQALGPDPSAQEHEEACDEMAGQALSFPLLDRVRLPLYEIVPWPRKLLASLGEWHDSKLSECHRFVCPQQVTFLLRSFGPVQKIRRPQSSVACLRSYENMPGEFRNSQLHSIKKYPKAQRRSYAQASNGVKLSHPDRNPSHPSVNQAEYGKMKAC